MTYEELLTKFTQKPYDELVKVGRGAVNQAMPEVQQLLKGNKEAAINYLVYLIGSCIGIDNSLTTLEVQYINDVLGLDNTFETYKNLALNCLKSDIIQALDNITDSLSEDNKFALGAFCACIFAVDKEVERNEVAYIAKLMD